MADLPVHRFDLSADELRRRVEFERAGWPESRAAEPATPAQHEAAADLIRWAFIADRAAAGDRWCLRLIDQALDGIGFSERQKASIDMQMAAEHEREAG